LVLGGVVAAFHLDRVVVTDGDVEIRYVLPTSPEGPHRPFCQLRKDHLVRLAGSFVACSWCHVVGLAVAAGPGSGPGRDRDLDLGDPGGPG
jgi:site-specific DNA recombinase